MTVCDPRRSISDRTMLETEGFEALQRLYAEAVHDEQEKGAVCARLLLGLYNGSRFPFDLTDLRTLPSDLFEDAMLVVRMDARVTRQEVHQYFAQGSKKFEDMVSDYRVVDVQRLRDGHDGAPRPPAEKGTLCDGDEVGTKLVTYGDAPGYRDVSLTLDCEVLGEQRKAVGTVRLGVRLGAEDGVAVMHHIQRVNVFAWRDAERGPLDRREGERRPSWLDHAPSYRAP